MYYFKYLFSTIYLFKIIVLANINNYCLCQESENSKKIQPVEESSTRKEHREVINIGLVLNPKNFHSNNTSLLKQLVLQQLQQINEENLRNDDLYLPYINLITTNLVEYPLEMSRIVCEQLIGYNNNNNNNNNKNKNGSSEDQNRGGVSAVIVDTDDEYTASIASISFALGLYNIPIIGTKLRDSSLFDRNLHPSYISLIPPHSHQADVWYNLMNKFHFKQAFVLTSSDNRDLLSRFVDLITHQSLLMRRQSDQEFKIEAIIDYDASSYYNLEMAKSYISDRISNLLENSICRVFLIHAQSVSDVNFFVDIINHLNMTKKGFALILSEEFFKTAIKYNITLPNGIITSQLSLNKQKMPDYQAYTLDALNIVVNTILEIKNTQGFDAFSKVPNSCKEEPSSEWFTGIELYYSMLRKTFSGHTGFICFDENGDRLTANYNLLNLASTQDDRGDLNQKGKGQSNGSKELIGSQSIRLVGTFKNGPNLLNNNNQQSTTNNFTINTNTNKESSYYSSKVDINVSLLEWPGSIKGQVISGVFINRHLRIVTLQEKPFVWVIESRECWSKSSNNSITKNSTKFLSIPCRKIISSDGRNYEQFCCEGYCMDLLEEISRQLNFTYDLYLAADNQYGNIVLESDNDYESQPPVVVNSSDGKDSKLASSTPPINNQQQQQQQQLQQLHYQLQQQHLLKSTKNYELVHNHHHQMESRLKWTGLMGELVSQRVDMAFAPLTITPQRAIAIDFSKPFKFHGFSIILRRASKHTTLASFLQPFHNQLWILVIGVATHVVALSLYLLDRYSTFGRFGIKKHFIPKTNRNSLDDHPLHLSSSLWFSWSILLNSGVGEHTPKSLSGRVLGIFWSGFAMIVVASYTANLAAFLVLDSREETPTLSGIDDPRLRSGDLAFNFATVKGSAVDAYLQSQVEYINLYRKMEEFNFDNVDDAILALRAGSIDALIWDSTRLEWEVATDEKCSLGIAGELFGSSGYGIGLQKNSYWTKNITTKLLELHESGFMIDLDKKWIAGTGTTSQHHQHSGGNCERKNDDYPETLGIFNIAGVFILFACGLFTSFGLILIERFCFEHRGVLLERQSRWWRQRRRKGSEKTVR